MSSVVRGVLQLSGRSFVWTSRQNLTCSSRCLVARATGVKAFPKSRCQTSKYGGFLWRGGFPAAAGGALISQDNRRWFQSWSALFKEDELRHTPADQGPVNVQCGAKAMTLEVEGQRSSYNSTWLRHNCHCTECQQPHSGQQLFRQKVQHPMYTLRSADVDGDKILLHWHEDDHMGEIPLEFLLDNDYSDNSRAARYKDGTPTAAMFKNKDDIPKISYQEICESDQGIYRWVSALNVYGLCLVQGVPTEPGMIRKAVEKICPLQWTLYGEIWDVVSTPEPINAAYSDTYLGYHTDLAYYESPPGLQILHCLKFDSCVEGGESMLLDGWVIAERMRERHPKDFKVLTTVPCTFQKLHQNREWPVYMRYQRPHIQLSSTGEINALHWSPQFEGPLFIPEDDIEPYYEAKYKFAQLMENSDAQIEFSLVPGDMISFNNRRIWHARRGFNLNGGSRHLQGCYVNIDDFKSRVNTLSISVGDGKLAKRVFNQDLG